MKGASGQRPFSPTPRNGSFISATDMLLFRREIFIYYFLHIEK
jgi:hypothetical protein